MDWGCRRGKKEDAGVYDKSWCKWSCYFLMGPPGKQDIKTGVWTIVAQMLSFWSVYWYWPGAQRRDWSCGYLGSNWYRRCLKSWAWMNSPTERKSPGPERTRPLHLEAKQRETQQKAREGTTTVRKCGFMGLREECPAVAAIHCHWEGGQEIVRRGSMEPDETWSNSLGSLLLR